MPKISALTKSNNSWSVHIVDGGMEGRKGDVSSSVAVWGKEENVLDVANMVILRVG